MIGEGETRGFFFQFSIVMVVVNIPRKIKTINEDILVDKVHFYELHVIF
jgi:hypothetical protein